MPSPKTRTLDAPEVIAARYGVGAALDRPKQANRRGAAGLTMVAEALAAVVVELDTRDQGKGRKGRQHACERA